MLTKVIVSLALIKHIDATPLVSNGNERGSWIYDDIEIVQISVMPTVPAVARRVGVLL